MLDILGPAPWLAPLNASTPGETYDEIINKLLEIVPEGDEEGKYTDDFHVGLLNSLIDFKEGRFAGHDEVKKRLGLS